MTPPLGIDARAAAEVPAGRGRYVRELLAALARTDDAADWRLYARAPHGELPFAWDLNGSPDPLWHLRVARRASRDCRAFLSTNSYLTAWFTRVPTAVVVMDLVAFDPEVRHHAQARAARIERATLGGAVRRAGALICISEATRRDLVARFPAAEGRAVAIPLAASARFAAPVVPARMNRPYVLAVGTIEPRKNLPRLVEAFRALPEDVRAGHVLAVVGPEGWKLGSAAVDEAEDVRVLGAVPEDELHALYAGAACFAYPSLFEGFGLPVLEAMAAGAPVVTSDRSSLPEVAGDAAVLVDPTDVRAIRDGLAAVLTDPARAGALRAAGRERARAFSWERTAAETRAVLDGLA